MKPTTFIATVAYSGYMRPAPGTWGSLASLPLAWLVAYLGGFLWISIICLLAFIVGVWVVKKETSGKDDHDPSEIVIDELVGQWIALMPVIYGAEMMNVDLLALWPGWITAFILFRFFDITKFGPIGWADKRNDAFGVMLDDVIAGFFAAIGVVIIGALFHAF